MGKKRLEPVIEARFALHTVDEKEVSTFYTLPRIQDEFSCFGHFISNDMFCESMCNINWICDMWCIEVEQLPEYLTSSNEYTRRAAHFKLECFKKYGR